jgi:polyhydroxyalkanoate synthesis regulator phasin
MKKDKNEIKKTTQDMKEEFNKDTENFRKKNQTEIPEINQILKSNKKNVERNSSRVEQVDDKISGF